MVLKKSAKNYVQKQMEPFWATKVIKLCPNLVLTNYGMNLFLSSHFSLKL